MTQDSRDKRNFLFFLNDVYPLSFDDSLTGALARPSSWEAVSGMIESARQKDVFVRSIKKVHVYVHVPFCGRICTFCHCNRVLLRRRSEIDAYINALARQMMFLAPVFKGMDAGTICFGGGTPSILNDKQIMSILDGADKAFGESDRKILFEINPSSWSASKLAAVSSRGLTRLSIGIQSNDERVLKQVNRPQTLKKVLWCLRSARKAKVPQVNVDLMAGLPGQTLKGLLQDIKLFIDEGTNIICVQPYTTLAWKELCSPGENVLAFFKRRDAMMKSATEMLFKAGYRHTGLQGAFTTDGEYEHHYQEEAYTRLEAAVAAFGPFAKGQVPGAGYYRTGAFQPTTDLVSVDASGQDVGFAMSHYALIAIIKGLDEKVFLERFGTTLDGHCGEGLRYLQKAGLVSFSKGVWKFTGKWEVRRIYEFFSLSRVLFGEAVLARLRKTFENRYDPRIDYSGDNFFLKAYANCCLMTLYYQMSI